MKKILSIFLLLVSTNIMAHGHIMLPVISIYDGDTIKTNLHLQKPLNKVSVRIYGIDAPEMPAKSYKTTGKLGRANCVKEAELAIKARARVVEIIGGHKLMEVTSFKWGRNGGRIVGIVHIHDVNIGRTLIKEGHAVRYFGRGKKHDWCQ